MKSVIEFKQDLDSPLSGLMSEKCRRIGYCRLIVVALCRAGLPNAITLAFHFRLSHTC